MSFFSPIVGTAIAIILIYALLSILVSVLVEWINHAQKSRGKMLRSAIEKMLDDPLNSSLGKKFFDHPMINGISEKDNVRHPQYLSPGMFADVLIDLINQESKEKTNTSISDSKELMKVFQTNLKDMKESAFRDMLLSFYQKGDGDYKKIKDKVEVWYNDQMDTVSGWYKTLQKNKFLIVGFIVAISLNVDSVYLFNMLSKNDSLRHELVAVAESTAEDYSNLTEEQRKNTGAQLAAIRVGLSKNQISTKENVTIIDSNKLDHYLSKTEELIGKLDSSESKHYGDTKTTLALLSDFSVPVGWSPNRAPLSWFNEYKPVSEEGDSGLPAYLDKRNSEATLSNVLLYLFGIIITGYSLSFGAPFWFDLLIKLVNVRRAGNKPSNSKS